MSGLVSLFRYNYEKLGFVERDFMLHNRIAAMVLQFCRLQKVCILQAFNVDRATHSINIRLKSFWSTT